jgi:hypothetical protein
MAMLKKASLRPGLVQKVLVTQRHPLNPSKHAEICKTGKRVNVLVTDACLCVSVYLFVLP